MSGNNALLPFGLLPRGSIERLLQLIPSRGTEVGTQHPPQRNRELAQGVGREATEVGVIDRHLVSVVVGERYAVNDTAQKKQNRNYRHQ